MGTLLHQGFSTSYLSTFVQTNGVAEINSGLVRMLKDVGAGGVDSWDENGGRTSGTNVGLVSGAVFYWQCRAPDTSSIFIAGVNRNDSIAKATAIGVYFNGATNFLAAWNGSGAGTDTAEAWTADTWYDFKLATKTPYTDGCDLFYRASTAPGALPDGVGSWISLGTTAAIHSGLAYVEGCCNLFTALAAGEYWNWDEYYHTTDGTFTTQTARASTVITDTCDSFDEWECYTMDGTQSIVGGAMRQVGNNGNFGGLGWFRKVPQTTQAGGYFFFKFRKDSAAGGIDMIGLGDERECNQFTRKPAMYYDSGQLYFYRGSATDSVDPTFSGNTWYYIKAKVNANGTLTFYWNKTGWLDAFAVAGTSVVAESANFINVPVRAYYYTDSSGASRWLDFDDYAYNPDGDEHPLYPEPEPVTTGGTAAFMIPMGFNPKRRPYHDHTHALKTARPVLASLDECHRYGRHWPNTGGQRGRFSAPGNRHGGGGFAQHFVA